MAGDPVVDSPAVAEAGAQQPDPAGVAGARTPPTAADAPPNAAVPVIPEAVPGSAAPAASDVSDGSDASDVSDGSDISDISDVSGVSGLSGVSDVPTRQGPSAAPSGGPTLAAPVNSARVLLASVFLLGTLLTLLGSVLPVWGYHRLDEFVAAGNHFLLLGVGFLVSNVFAARSATRYARFVYSPLPGAAMALAGLLVFAFLPPPFPVQLQLAGAFAIGLAMGALNAAIFQQFGALAALRSSTAFHLASVFGLLGAAITPLAVALVVTPSNSLALLVLAPAPLLVGFTLRAGHRTAPPQLSDRSLREALADFRSPPAVLLTLLLLFQLGNEMAMFGWLPVFLIQRLGVSPATALYGLATFSLALLAGRVAVQAMARHALRNRLVLSGLAIALLGCSMLAVTNNLFGALLGAVLCGIGFAPIYPAALELIGRRFPYFHPGVFNSIFSIGFVGALLAPWSLGLLNHTLGIQTVMVLPIFGLLTVALILGLLWLEAKLTGGLR
jgi:MFS family permease